MRLTCVLVVVLAALGLVTAVPPTPLPIDNGVFVDPFTTTSAVIMLHLNVFTLCPQDVKIVVTITGTGGIDSPQFALEGSWGPTPFAGDQNKCGHTTGPNYCGATVAYDRTGNVAKLTFTHIHDYTPAKDSQGNLLGTGWWNFFVAIPVSNFLEAGSHPLVIVQADSTHPSISTRDINDFEAFLTEICRGPSIIQDPIFTGFQGQVYQFHGLPDEHFNLVSSPSVQVNSHFVYLSSGKCDYNDTACWTHPGTYLDVLGFTLGSTTRVKVQAGSHDAGMRVWIQDVEIPPQQQRIITAINNSSIDTATIIYHSRAQLQVLTPILSFVLENSDQFINLNVALNDMSLLRAGAHRHEVSDHNVCRSQATHDHQLVETMVAKKYHTPNSLHGLIGQTWRNVNVCGRDWMGQVEDYLVQDGIFGTSYNYNYFSKQN